MQGPYDTMMHECASLEGGTSNRILMVLEKQLVFSTRLTEALRVSSYLRHAVSFQDSSGAILGCSRIVTLSAVAAAHRGKTTFSQFSRILPATFILENVTGTCSSRESIFDPWSPREEPVGVTETPDQFPVGDLSKHPLELFVFLFEISLIGRGTILGHVVSSDACNF